MQTSQNLRAKMNVVCLRPLKAHPQPFSTHPPTLAAEIEKQGENERRRHK